jgi:6-phosphofructokinase 1
VPEGLAARRPTRLSRSPPCTCPKTVDNDLPITDNCPGFGSVAKYVAISMMEAGLDVESMAKTSDQGLHPRGDGPSRRAGSRPPTGARADHAGTAPHVLLLPEIAFDEDAFLAKVKEAVERYGYARSASPRVCTTGTASSSPSRG